MKSEKWAWGFGSFLLRFLIFLFVLLPAMGFGQSGIDHERIVAKIIAANPDDFDAVGAVRYFEGDREEPWKVGAINVHPLGSDTLQFIAMVIWVGKDLPLRAMTEAYLFDRKGGALAIIAFPAPASVIEYGGGSQLFDEPCFTNAVWRLAGDIFAFEVTLHSSHPSSMSEMEETYLFAVVGNRIVKALDFLSKKGLASLWLVEGEANNPNFRDLMRDPSSYTPRRTDQGCICEYESRLTSAPTTTNGLRDLVLTTTEYKLGKDGIRRSAREAMYHWQGEAYVLAGR